MHGSPKQDPTDKQVSTSETVERSENECTKHRFSVPTGTDGKGHDVQEPEGGRNVSSTSRIGSPSQHAKDEIARHDVEKGKETLSPRIAKKAVRNEKKGKQRSITIRVARVG